VVLLAAGAAAAAAGGKPVPPRRPELPVVGDARQVEVVPDLERAVRSGGRARWTRVVELSGAAFVKPHFSLLALAPGDQLVVRSASGRVIERLTGRGPKDRGTFWGLSAPGERLLLELEFDSGRVYDAPPFVIDRVIAGRPGGLASVQTVCLPPDFEDAICYQGDPDRWANIQASAGVMVFGGDPNALLFCSGANVSPLGYVLTNQHCILDQADCDNVEFVFGFRRVECGTGAPPSQDWQGYRCDEVVAQSPFEACEADPDSLDFTLASVVGDPTSTYGAATPDPTPLTSGEEVYIVQHPLGRPQEITHGGGTDLVVDGHTVRYYGTLDTEPGSSGSPIFRAADHLLAGLHHCGVCDEPQGNRGMLMSEIHPLIESFLCSQTLTLAPASPVGVEEVSGNGNPVIEPGETWRFVPRVRNLACLDDALDVSAEVALNPASSPEVGLPARAVEFGDIPAQQVGEAAAPVVFTVGESAGCGGSVVLDLIDVSASGGPFPDVPEVLSASLGELVRTTLLAEHFGAGIPSSWTVMDGGTGTGPAATWTTQNPGERTTRLSTPPFAICDSDELGINQMMDEQLISPPVDASGFSGLEISFHHDFNWYELGLDEKGDVDVRSSATGGVWTNVLRFEDHDDAGLETADVGALGAGAGDFQLRFHYHDARFEWWWAVDSIAVLGNNGYVCETIPVFRDGFESGDTSAWSGSVP